MTVTSNSDFGVLFSKDLAAERFPITVWTDDDDDYRKDVWNGVDIDGIYGVVTVSGYLFSVHRLFEPVDGDDLCYLIRLNGTPYHFNRHEWGVVYDPMRVAAFCVLMAPMTAAGEEERFSQHVLMLGRSYFG